MVPGPLADGRRLLPELERKADHPSLRPLPEDLMVAADLHGVGVGADVGRRDLLVLHQSQVVVPVIIACMQ
jgi:hypothetical protein